MKELLPLLAVLPLSAAISCTILKNKCWQFRISILSSFLVLLISLLIAFQFQQPFRYTLAGWGPPLGIDWYLDGLSVLLICLLSFIGFVLTVYSGYYFTNEDQARRFWPLWWLLFSGLISLFLSADIFNIYVTIEIISLSAVALVAMQNERTALEAALRYLLASLFGSLCYLLGIALLYRSTGTLDMYQIAQVLQPGALSFVCFFLIFIGLTLKTALFPLHFWLPKAHSNALAPISAVLSALVVKASFYLMIRFVIDIYGDKASELILELCALLGAMAILYGSWMAFKSQRLKLMVAYSTVAQIGYLFLLFPLLLTKEIDSEVKSVALVPIVMMILAHALAKSSMFLTVGNIVKVNGVDSLSEIKGLVQSQPLLVWSFAIAGISLIGLPLSLGFIAKWLILEVLIQSEQWWWVLVVATGGLLTALYIFKVLSLAFATPNQSGLEPKVQVKLPLALCALVLAITSLLSSFASQVVFDLLSISDM